MITTISNEWIAFTSESRNVWPLMLRFNDEILNYFWQPGADGSSGSEICFPTLGTLPDFRYHLKGKWYDMDMHGFAKDSDFTVELDKRRVVYELRESPKTLEQYPYAFRLQVVYSVEGDELFTEYRVFNPNDEVLPFSVGGHPRFSCPMDPTEDVAWEDYYLEFDAPVSIDQIVKSYGPIEIIKESMSADGRRIRLSEKLFEKGCFCFSPFAAKRIAVKSDKSRRAITMTAPTVTHMQIWKSPGGRFIALEPWYGSITSVPPRKEECDWLARKGTIMLPPGETYSARYGIRIER